jgi:hypothetical protein
MLEIVLVIMDASQSSSVLRRGRWEKATASVPYPAAGLLSADGFGG